MEVERRADDALAAELRGVEIDEEELLRALELQLRRAAVVAFLFLGEGGDPGVAGDFDALRFGRREGGSEKDGQQAGSHARGEHGSNENQPRGLSIPIRAYFAGTKPAGRRSSPATPVSLSPSAWRAGSAKAERRRTMAGFSAAKSRVSPGSVVRS